MNERITVCGGLTLGNDRHADEHQTGRKDEEKAEDGHRETCETKTRADGRTTQNPTNQSVGLKSCLETTCREDLTETN